MDGPEVAVGERGDRARRRVEWRRRLRHAEVAALEGADDGFTLIELMVVLLVLAILMAIAIPQFLGVSVGAQERAAQANLANALTEARIIFIDSGDEYPANIMSQLNDQAPALQFAATSDSPNQIGVEQDQDAAGLTAIDMVVRSNDGVCWFITDVVTDAPTTDIVNSFNESFGTGTWYGSDATHKAVCSLDWDAAPGVSDWARSWPI